MQWDHAGYIEPFWLVVLLESPTGAVQAGAHCAASALERCTQTRLKWSSFSPGIAHGVATWKGKDLDASVRKGWWLQRPTHGSIPEDAGASPRPRALRGFVQHKGTQVRPRHADLTTQNPGDTMLLMRPRRRQWSLERGAGSGPATRGTRVSQPRGAWLFL